MEVEDVHSIAKICLFLRLMTAQALRYIWKVINRLNLWKKMNVVVVVVVHLINVLNTSRARVEEFSE